jgi:hypothetical protein
MRLDSRSSRARERRRRETLAELAADVAGPQGGASGMPRCVLKKATLAARDLHEWITLARE